MSVTSQVQNEAEKHIGCGTLDQYVMAYNECRHWRLNCFRILKCSVGSAFVDHLANMYKEAILETNEQNNALYKILVFCQLILQRPGNLKISVLRKTLERRLDLWKNYKLYDMLNEAKVLQSRIYLRNKELKNDSNWSERLSNFLQMEEFPPL
ncbi:hypothetical protein GJ496_009955 [Pomphorhynchus laevis]|nr:hypothetical protein GJ496_009955 [Pomphorhynchus laevis]